MLTRPTAPTELPPGHLPLDLRPRDPQLSKTSISSNPCTQHPARRSWGKSPEETPTETPAPSAAHLPKAPPPAYPPPIRTAAPTKQATEAPRYPLAHTSPQHEPRLPPPARRPPPPKPVPPGKPSRNMTLQRIKTSFLNHTHHLPLPSLHRGQKVPLWDIISLDLSQALIMVTSYCKRRKAG